MKISPKPRPTNSRISALAPPNRGAAAFWCETTTPLGQLYISANEQGLGAIKFGRLEPDLDSLCNPQTQRHRLSKLSKQVCRQLKEYFYGRRRVFDLPLDLSSLTPFQLEVLTVTRRIPWGEVWSYQRVAGEMGRPKSSRPVGQALARNPIPIVIPCHRVIASDGGLGGYCGETGLDIKRRLLRLEGVQL